MSDAHSMSIIVALRRLTWYIRARQWKAAYEAAARLEELLDGLRCDG